MPALVAALVSAITAPGLSSHAPLVKFAFRPETEFTALLRALLIQSAKSTSSNTFFIHTAILLPFTMIRLSFMILSIEGKSQGLCS
jgi:hypothetical protein